MVIIETGACHSRSSVNPGGLSLLSLQLDQSLDLLHVLLGVEGHQVLARRRRGARKCPIVEIVLRFLWSVLYLSLKVEAARTHPINIVLRLFLLMR